MLSLLEAGTVVGDATVLVLDKAVLPNELYRVSDDFPTSDARGLVCGNDFGLKL